MNTELQAATKSPVELCEVVLVPKYPTEKIHALLHAYDLKNLVLLECLTGDVERKVLRVDNTLDEVEILGDNVITIVHDEDEVNIELCCCASLS